MQKSNLLRVQDVRDAYRLIGDCRDLGNDPALWHGRMLQGVCELIGAPHAAGGEGWWPEPHGPIQPVSAYDSGNDPAFSEGLQTYHRVNGVADDPVFCALRRLARRRGAHTRRELVSDAVWYVSAMFNEYLRPLALDDRLLSVYSASETAAISVINVQRASGDREFSSRERQLLEFFHGELGRLIGRALVSSTEPTLDKLSPRLRETLSCLLEGDSEKQIAARLALSPATTHQYVTALYRHFGVHSRAQLLAYALKRPQLVAAATSRAPA